MTPTTESEAPAARPRRPQPTRAERAERIRTLCRERGLVLLERPGSFRVIGRDVDILTTSLSLISPRELRPCEPVEI